MALELRSVNKRVNAETYLADVDLVLEPGHFNVLLGGTNAGKTTLIKLIAGLDRVSSGEILFNGKPITDLTTQERGLSLVHQFFINYPNLTVFENIESPLRVARLPRSERERRVHEVAELLQLGPFLARLPSQLSGGQQQRTALARAIVKDAGLVLLDEPFANLDYKLREELRDQLPRLFSDRGAVVVYATSDPAEALVLGGRTAALYEGRVVQFGDTVTCYRCPESLVSAAVFSDPPINIAKAMVLDGRVRVTEGFSFAAPSALADGDYSVAIRPYRVRPRPVAEPASGMNAIVRGRVLVAELNGSESVAHFCFGPHRWISQCDGVHPFTVGSEQEFSIDTTGCLYFDRHGQRVA